MLPVAEENGKVLIVEPAVADAITGEKWNRFIFRTSRNSTQDAYGGCRGDPARRRESASRRLRRITPSAATAWRR